MNRREFLAASAAVAVAPLAAAEAVAKPIPCPCCGPAMRDSFTISVFDGEKFVPLTTARQIHFAPEVTWECVELEC